MKTKSVVAILALILFCAIPKYSFAAFNVSARPYEGGHGLTFGRVNNYGPFATKEVTVDITSDIGKRYQLIQTLLEPLTSYQGVSIQQNNFSVYALRGSNKSGTISVEQETPVSQSRTLIYTSSQEGLQDSFILVYVLKYPFNVPSGSYRGRIAFTLEPIGSTQQQVTAILDIFAEISAEAGIEITTGSGSKIISLNSSRDDKLSADVLFNIKADMGSQFRIIQFLTSPFESSEGTNLAYEAVNFQVSEAKKGRGSAQKVALSNRPEEIYTSGAKGDADSFYITYGLVEPEKQKAGRYKGNIKYSIESPTVNQLLGDIYLEVEIARVFDLIVTPELGGLIEFRDLKPKEPPKQTSVVIEINSNIAKQYQVSQELISGLVNKDGKALPQKCFTLREESLNTKGRLQFSSSTEVKIGQMILFVSDQEGSADKFRIIYEIGTLADVTAGDYSSRITYSISEI